MIDPLYTETAGFASRHVAPRPGTDYAILAYLVREVLREGADQEVLARSTVDGDVLRTAVEPFNREHAAEFSDLVEQGYAETGHEFPAPWIDAHIERLGGWKLAPSALVEQLVSMSNAQSGDRRSPKSLSLIPRRQRRHLNAQFLFLGSPADVLLHPTDAASAGVIDGQQVIVRSARGEIVGTAQVDTSIRPGVVSVPHGHEHANVNYLTSTQEVDPVTGMARYSGIQVSVHPIPAAFQAPGLPAQSSVEIA